MNKNHGTLLKHYDKNLLFILSGGEGINLYHDVWVYITVY